MPSPLKFAVVAAACAVAAVVAGAAGSELAFDHLSLNVGDPSAATEWYASHLGGVRDGDAAVRFGSVRLSFRKSTTSKPSEGSVIDHLAFVADSMPPGFSQDPWGTRLEIVRTKSTETLHHIHVLATNPEATMTWLTQSFGGARTRVDRFDGVKYGPVLVAVDRVDHEPAPSAGHVIDHMGWNTPNLDAAAEALMTAGVKFTTQPRTAGNLRMAFVEGPNQLRVEIVQR